MSLYRAFSPFGGENSKTGSITLGLYLGKILCSSLWSYKPRLPCLICWGPRDGSGDRMPRTGSVHNPRLSSTPAALLRFISPGPGSKVLNIFSAAAANEAVTAGRYDPLFSWPHSTSYTIYPAGQNGTSPYERIFPAFSYPCSRLTRLLL
jgi:hypothetical protein